MITVGAGCSLGLGLRPRFFLILIRDKLEPLGPAGPAGPEQRAVSQLTDNLGQGAIQIFGRDHRDFQFQPLFGGFFYSRHESILGV